MLEFPTITALTAAGLIILQMVLGMRTSMARLKLRQSMGDGGNPEMAVTMRMHGNLTENAPIVLIVLGLLELSGANTLAISVLAAVFFIARLLHPIGLSIKKSPNIARFLGGFSTNMVGIISGVWLLIIAVQQL